mmetsp:Transcript_120657/g.219395  ORF Transcript_120657/g.219395 Transcript_120657/m.219395 type:complete len:512 (+) Transcript_120657:100-1635(+)
MLESTADLIEPLSHDRVRFIHPLRELAKLLLAISPAAGWQVFGAGHGRRLRLQNLARRDHARSHLETLMTPGIPGPSVVDRAAPARRVKQSSINDAGPMTKQFDWYKHWYPVNVVDTMDPTRTHEVQLLGLNLVAWNDGATVDKKKQSGTWHVSVEACTHCKAYPSKVEDGFLWVFPYNGPHATNEAAQVALPLISELHDPAVKDRWKWRIPAGVRNFPCGWDAMLENTLDPAHFLCAHHGTLSNRYTDPAPYEFEMERKIDKEGGFAMTGGMGKLEFVPPCLVKYTPDYAGMPFKGALVIATYLVPTRPGWVRPLANVLYDKDRKLGNTIAERALRLFIAGLTPDWAGHIGSSVVLHQDAGLLYKQFRNMRERGYNDPALEAKSSKRYEQLVFCPNGIDKGVLAFRQWLRTYAGNGVPWACQDELLPRGSEDIYDMWYAHTEHCQYCQTAHRNLQIAKYASLVLGVIAVLGVQDGTREPLLAIAAVLLAGALHKVTQLFQRYEYSHADCD